MIERMLPVLLTSTAQIEQRVWLFQVLGTIFGTVAVLFLAVSLFLFFRFDIRTVIGEKTGRIAKRSIAELERETAQSGKLRNARNSKKRDTSGKLDVHKVFQTLEEEGQKSLSVTPSCENTGQDLTSVLETGRDADAVLNSGESGTSVLDHRVHYEGPDDAPTESLVMERKTDIGKFVIIKNIMLIHTDEYI